MILIAHSSLREQGLYTISSRGSARLVVGDGTPFGSFVRLGVTGREKVLRHAWADFSNVAKPELRQIEGVRVAAGWKLNDSDAHPPIRKCSAEFAPMVPERENTNNSFALLR
jgi:hypothetical protein